jgi:hypothetical protein
VILFSTVIEPPMVFLTVSEEGEVVIEKLTTEEALLAVLRSYARSAGVDLPDNLRIT